MSKEPVLAAEFSVISVNQAAFARKGGYRRQLMSIGRLKVFKHLATARFQVGQDEINEWLRK